MVQVVHHPGRKQLRERDASEFGVRAALGEIDLGEIQLGQRRERVPPCLILPPKL